MISVIFHTRGISTQENGSFVVDHYVSGDVHFSLFGELISNYFLMIDFALRVT